ncbi:Hypothetical protein D9617_8g051520 [Elsinoe fawcettii]|nr:Hypothetical protein D9617_8g051520 [Elsinoe fawcettii]
MSLPSANISLNATTAPSAYYSSSFSGGTTYLQWQNTYPTGGVPAPPIDIPWYLNGSWCHINIRPSYVTWINDSLLSPASILVTLDSNNSTVGTSKICKSTVTTLELLRQYLDSSCNPVAVYRGLSGRTSSTQTGGPSSIFLIGPYIYANWLHASTKVAFGSTIDTPLYYTDAIHPEDDASSVMPSLAKYIPGLSSLIIRCSTVAFGEMPQTLTAANFITAYSRATEAGDLTQPLPDTSTPVARPPLAPYQPANTNTATRTEVPVLRFGTTNAASETNAISPGSKSTVVQVVQSALTADNNTSLRGDLPSGKSASAQRYLVVAPGVNISPGAIPSTVLGHEIYMPALTQQTPQRPDVTLPEEREEGVIVIDTTTIPLGSLDTYLSTAVPDLQRASVSMISARPSAVPALVVGGNTMTIGGPAMTINGRVLSLPTQSIKPHDGTAYSHENDLRVVLDGSTMTYSQATALPELMNADIRLLATMTPNDGGGTGNPGAGDEGDQESGGSTAGTSAGGGDIAGWIMRGLGSSSAASGNPSITGTSQSGGRSRNGTTPFTGSGTRLRPTLLASVVPFLTAALLDIA